MLLDGPLGGWLAEQATAREDAKKQSANRLFWVLLALIPLLVFGWMFVPLGIEFRLFIGAGLLTVGATWSQMPKQHAKTRVKVGINEAIARSLGLTYEHEFTPGDAFELAKTYRLVPGFDRSSFEDRWSGTLGDFPFELFEAKLEERRGSGKNRHWVTVFRGVILAVGFRRRFHGSTLVARDGKFRTLFFTRKQAIKLNGEDLQSIALTDPRFEDTFDLWSSDPVEAHYLVHPNYVERLIALEQGFSGDDIRALFHGGQLVVALSAPDMFESGSINAEDDRARIEQTVAQFGKMADLAATLNEPER